MPQRALNPSFTFSFLLSHWWHDTNKQSSFISPPPIWHPHSLLFECYLADVIYAVHYPWLWVQLMSCAVLCADTHTHTHTHFSILKTDICSEVSVAWICGLFLFLSFIKSFIMCSFLCVCGDARVIQIAPDYTSEGNGSRGLQRRWFWSSQLSSCFLTRPVTALFAGINCCNLWFFFFFLLLELL